MIYFFIRTKAQFIKVVPLMIEMQNSHIPIRCIDSGQHAELTRTLRWTCGIPEPVMQIIAGKLGFLDGELWSKCVKIVNQGVFFKSD